jgi:hypothetical protein
VLLEIGESDTVAREGTRFCGDHGYLRQRRASFDEAYANYERAIDLPTSVPGILYRPRQSYRAYIYVKDDPKGPDPWRLVQTVQLRLENISPVVSLGVERAIFSARRTAFLFDRGTLVGWCVSKKSELLAAMEIPLEVVRSIVALPTAILQVRIDEVTRSNDLAAAERDLISIQRQYISFLLNPNLTTSPLPNKQKDDLTAADTQKPSLQALADSFGFQTESQRQAAAFGSSFNSVCAAPPRATQVPAPGSRT